MTKKEVIQTLIDDYTKQAKLSKREQTIFEHGLLTGIQIDSIEKPEVDLETFDKRVTEMWGRCAANPNDTIACLHIDSFIDIAKHFYELGLTQKGE